MVKERFSLVGINGNAFSVMGYVKTSMMEMGKTKEEIDKYLEDAKSSDYDHLLSVSIDMVENLNSIG